MKLLAKNKRATFDYEIAERVMAGISLLGVETKSAKAGQASLKGSFVTARNGELYLMGSHISPYTLASVKDYDPTRSRKLLLHRREIEKLIQKKQEGFSIIPTAFLLDRNFVKIELGVGRGKKRYDKREAIKKRENDRVMARVLQKSS
jgi:SsrA-binding protein